MQTPRQFFKQYAGWSYDPKKETPAQGKDRGARRLAAAERKASLAGFAFQWQLDPCTDSSDFSNERPPWKLWQCLMLDAEGECRQSLHAIDFGRDKEPWGDPYRRVVEAELAVSEFYEGG